jgi:hypothetical protein
LASILHGAFKIDGSSSYVHTHWPYRNIIMAGSSLV